MIMSEWITNKVPGIDNFKNSDFALFTMDGTMMEVDKRMSFYT